MELLLKISDFADDDTASTGDVEIPFDAPSEHAKKAKTTNNKKYFIIQIYIQLIHKSEKPNYF